MQRPSGGANGRHPNRALVIVSHQSMIRKPNPGVQRLCRGMRRRMVFGRVYSTNIALKDRLEQIATRLWRAGIRQMDVFPYFLHEGFHVRVELPKRLMSIRKKYPALDVRQWPHLGCHPDLAELAADLLGVRD